MTRSLLLLAAALFLSAAETGPASARAEPKAAGHAKPETADLAPAVNVLARLDELDSIFKSTLPPRELTSRARKLSSSLAGKVSDLRDGEHKTDLKSDLATALHFYERAADPAAPRAARCDAERPGAYTSLCEKVSGDRRELSLAKARLHAAWARARLELLRGESLDENMRDALRQSEAERAFEREVAREAVAELRRLGEKVLAYDSLAAFEEGRGLARVPYEDFSEELERAAPRLRRMTGWLSRGACREEIRKATQSYLDGAWWWAKAQRPLVVRVTNNSFAENHPAHPRPVADGAARYTVAVLWRQAREYTRRAEEAIV